MKRLLEIVAGRGGGALLQLALLYRLSDSGRTVAGFVTLLIAMGFVSSLLRAGAEFELLHAAATGRIGTELSRQRRRVRRGVIAAAVVATFVAAFEPTTALWLGAAVFLGGAHYAGWVASALLEARGWTLASSAFQGLTLYLVFWAVLPLIEAAHIGLPAYASVAALTALLAAVLAIRLSTHRHAKSGEFGVPAPPRERRDAIAAMQISTSGLALLVVWLADRAFGTNAAAIFGISQRLTVVLGFGLAVGTWVVARPMMLALAQERTQHRPLTDLRLPAFLAPALVLGVSGIVFASEILETFVVVPSWGPSVLSLHLIAAVVNAGTGPVFVYYRFAAGDGPATRLVIFAVAASAAVVAVAFVSRSEELLAAAPLSFATVANLVPLWRLSRRKEARPCLVK